MHSRASPFGQGFTIKIRFRISVRQSLVNQPGIALVERLPYLLRDLSKSGTRRREVIVRGGSTAIVMTIILGDFKGKNIPL